MAHVLGSSVDDRVKLVARMLQRSPNEAISFWLQLAVSIGIATLGLVVGSAAVIIGAMLVAPLMGPIVALAMGLATGSPFLVLRSAGRIVMSVAVAIGGAALITVLLPFHELNSEIAARTSPTALDLLTAGFCAVAGVYASLRPGSDTTATAAGTSIGISLVPPLCASGYGIGTAAWSVAGGAALLFLTNLVAIIFVGTISFLALGFNRVSVTGLERQELDGSQNALITAAVARRLSGLFESRAGPALRFVMPFVLLAAVYVPLRRALDEVAWQVRVRASVQAALRREPHQIVESRLRVERHEVELLVVLLGNTRDAEAAKTRLDAEIKAVSGVVPRMEVLAIPDATALAGLESSLRAKDPLITPRLPLPTPAEQLERGRSLVRSSVLGLWPGASAGEPLAVQVGVEETGPLSVRVVHLGPTLGPDAVEGLSRALGATLAREVRVVDVAVPLRPLTRTHGDSKFLSDVAVALRASAAVDSLNVCVVEPPASKLERRPDRQQQEFLQALGEVLAAHPRVTKSEGDEWAVRFSAAPCSTPEPAPADEAPADQKAP